MEPKGFVQMFVPKDTSPVEMLQAQYQAQQEELQFLHKKLAEKTDGVQLRVLALQVAVHCKHEWSDETEVISVARAVLDFLQESPNEG